MTKPRPLHPIALALALALVSVSACASFKALDGRIRYMKDQAKVHVYQQPLTHVLGDAKWVLQEQGFKVKDKYTSLETEPKEDGDMTTQITVTGTQVDDKSCRIEMVRASKGGLLGNQTERDLDLEWAVLKRADPDAAKKIEEESKAAGEKAKTQPL